MILQSDLLSEAIQQRKSLKYPVLPKMGFLFPKRLLTLADYHNSLEILALRHLCNVEKRDLTNLENTPSSSQHNIDIKVEKKR